MALTIVGAGLTGLLSAHAWPQAGVVEAAPEHSGGEHKALLRFRSDAVARLTGIDFHPVTVRKGIWFGGKFVQPSIGVANLYARKVTGALTGDRSIWNLAPVERWIAPEDFYEQLLDNVGSRISWNSEYDFGDNKRPVINTAPLPTVLKALAPPCFAYEFKRAPIKVHRFRVEGADVYQTIYFPESDISVYRASITGSMLIAELIGFEAASPWLNAVTSAFGLEVSELKPIDNTEQKYGKIVPLPDSDRKQLLHILTAKHSIFSLGRFATWRNVLLDDVVQDIAVVRRLMRASEYDRRKFSST